MWCPTMSLGLFGYEFGGCIRLPCLDEEYRDWCVALRACCVPCVLCVLVGDSQGLCGWRGSRLDRLPGRSHRVQGLNLQQRARCLACACDCANRNWSGQRARVCVVGLGERAQ